ncbi:unnamed protein product, partial [Protopolystoma xenopodis]
NRRHTTTISIVFVRFYLDKALSIIPRNSYLPANMSSQCSEAIVSSNLPHRRHSAQITCIVCSNQSAFNIFSRCLHCICNNCVDCVAEREVFKCPLCDEISPKLYLNAILAKHDALHASPNCTWCQDNGESTKSVGHCKDCDNWLCAECVKGHNRMPPFRSHNVEMSSDTTDRGINCSVVCITDALRCEIHPRETLELFCESCGVLTCRDCQLSVHREHGGHRWVGEKAALLRGPLEEAAKELTKQRIRLLRANSDALNALKFDQKSDSTGSMEANVAKALYDVDSRADALIASINNHRRLLKEGLSLKAKEHRQLLRSAIEIMRKLQDQIDFALNFEKRLVDNVDDDPASLVQLHTSLEALLHRLSSRVSRIVSDSPPSFDMEAEYDDEQAKLANATDLSQNPSAWRQNSLGWKASMSARVALLGNRDPDELARLSCAVFWFQESKKRSRHKRPAVENKISKLPNDFESGSDTECPSSPVSAGKKRPTRDVCLKSEHSQFHNIYYLLCFFSLCSENVLEYLYIMSNWFILSS